MENATKTKTNKHGIDDVSTFIEIKFNYLRETIEKMFV